ncbi:hypothetical protein DFH07DRAFT_796012 [Mycena maculata]|uniref:TLC domain-containing protein n=1 Tax=Mycena maculata TaxID=230809 RepID=A0AAD7KA78_9AGAR|nr:hypothetical protein DFH07DRAFT_796012 [Mycena maculata]
MRSESPFNALAVAAVTIFFHHALRKLYPTKRQRAWIITGLSSAAMCLGSIPFVLDIAESRGDITALRPRYRLAALICRAFQGFLLADLIVGSRYYPSHVTICWGWIHHNAYIVLLHYLVRRGWAHCFCLAAVMELPTLHLSLAFLHPRFRHDWLFCGFFLATRIVFHLFLLGVMLAPMGRSVVQGSRLPATFLALAFPGHAVWFMQSVRGAIRRSRSKEAATPVALQSPSDSDFIAFVDQPIVSATLVPQSWKHGTRVILRPI